MKVIPYEVNSCAAIGLTGLQDVTVDGLEAILEDAIIYSDYGALRYNVNSKEPSYPGIALAITGGSVHKNIVEAFKTVGFTPVEFFNPVHQQNVYLWYKKLHSPENDEKARQTVIKLQEKQNRKLGL